MGESTKPTSTLRIREIIKILNKMNLVKADYNNIKRLIKEMIFLADFNAEIHASKSQYFRGRISKDKLSDISDLTYPPSKNILNYQRCNSPHKPMFYCTESTRPIYSELNVQPGDIVYLSNWSLKEDIYVITIPPDLVKEEGDKRNQLISAYFDTVFSQPIHETYTEQYKITSAISEVITEQKISFEDTQSEGSIKIPEVSLKYPSVQYPSEAYCLAFHPEIVDQYLNLEYVEEILVTEAINRTYRIERKDGASNFKDGKINWTGRPLNWKIEEPGKQLNMKAELGSWVARDTNGNIVNPE